MSLTNSKMPEHLGTYFLAIISSAILGLLAVKINGLFVLVGIAVFAMIVIKPEIATLYVIALLFTNIPALASQFHGVPKMVAGTFTLLLCIPLGVYIFARREKLKFDFIMILITLFLTVSIISSLFAIDKDIAIGWIVTLILEGLVLYFLIINVVRDLAVLKKVVWVMIISASLLGTLSLYQELSHSYKNDFGGLAQRNLEADSSPGDLNNSNKGAMHDRDNVRTMDRAGGPLGGPNRYAQVMLVVFFLALFQFWGVRKLNLRIPAALTLVLILSGVLLTYSRGAFVTLGLLLLLLAVMRYIKIYQIVGTVVILFVLISIASPGYMARMGSIGGIQGLFSKDSEQQPDAVTRGRTTEMLAALMAFLDHPLLGVGPGQYAPYYSMEYQMDPDIALRYISKSRRAHILYFELAAETGIVGFLLFMAIVSTLIYRLWFVRKRWRDTRPDLANIATSVMFGILAYLGTAVFLHLAYQRYLWLFLGIAGAVIHIEKSLSREEGEEQQSFKPARHEIKENAIVHELNPLFEKAPKVL